MNSTDEFSVGIDLGKSSEAMQTMPPPKKGKKSEKYYPSVYLSGIEGLESLPKEGQALIDFKVRSKTVSEREGRTDRSCELEILRIHVPSDGGESKPFEEDLDDFVKKAGKKPVEKEEEEEEDEE